MPDNTATQPKLSGEAKLDKLLKKANVPTLPMVAQKLIELCKDDNANFAQFARVIETDQGMSSKLLRVANSAYYGLRNKATTLERAIRVLGLKYVQSITLGFHLATTLNKFEACGFDMADFWYRCVFRAVLARQIANHYCPDRSEEAFLVGLLQDCGIPVLIEAYGQQYAHLWHNGHNSQSSLYQLECELFQFDHVTAAAVITEQWSLPDLLANPIRNHHNRTKLQPSQDEKLQLRQVAYFVGTLSLNDPESLTKEDVSLAEYARKVLGLDKSGLKKILQSTRQEFSGVSQLFAGILPEKVDVTELLTQANHLISDLTQEAQRKIFDFESELEQFKTKCEELVNSVEHYRHEAQTDPLTGLAARPILIKYLETNYPYLRSGDVSLTILFINIDDFGEINNIYGHAEADRLLTVFARMLQKIFGDIGCVARYGGVEFVVALVGLQLEQAVQLAKALVERTCSLPLPANPDISTDKRSLSCSIGMVCCEAGTSPDSPEEMLETACRQMYQARQPEKNGLSYKVITSGK
ncbi:MAG: GGDEF domain-containing protein [Sedimentisphaerales bacterium]|nr:GGDEF domain-containing protein [Sedimentisphaerales bacterium]